MERTPRQLVGNAQSLQFRRQIVYSQPLLSIGQDDAPLDHILQLPDVARPSVPGQGAKETGSHAPLLLLMNFGKHPQEILSQQRDVFSALPQRRQWDFANGEPEIAI